MHRSAKRTVRGIDQVRGTHRNHDFGPGSDAARLQRRHRRLLLRRHFACERLRRNVSHLRRLRGFNRGRVAYPCHVFVLHDLARIPVTGFRTDLAFEGEAP